MNKAVFTIQFLRALAFVFVFLGIQTVVSGIGLIACQKLGYAQWVGDPYFSIAVSLVFSLVTIVVFLLAKWAVPSADYLRSKPYGLAFWVISAALGSVIPSTALQELLPELPNLIEQQMAEIMRTRGGYFVICLLVPFVEELVFRGAVLRTLLHVDGVNHWVAITLSALFFSAAHLNPAQMPHAFLIGLLLGWMYARTRSIVPCVLFHWVNNTIAYLMFMFYPSTDIGLVDIFGSSKHVILSVVFSLNILLPALYQLNLRMPHNKK